MPDLKARGMGTATCADSGAGLGWGGGLLMKRNR